MDYFTIVLYLTVFSISTLLIYCSECYLRRDKKVASILWALLAIIVPCILAALRDPRVGPDSLIYVMPNFRFAASFQGQSFFYFLENMPKQTELGFALLMYIGILFDNLGITYFLIQFFVLFPVYFFLTKYRNVTSISLGWLLFLFISYNFSFSGMRCSIAMSCIPLSFYYLSHGNKLKSTLMLLFASCFHVSAILIYLILYVILFVTRSNNWKLKAFAIIGMVSLFVVVQYLLPILTVIVEIINPRYMYYLEEYIGHGRGLSDIPISDLFCKTILIGIATAGIRYCNKMSDELKVMFWIVVVGRVFVLFNSVFYESMRIAFYFDMFLVVYVPSFMNVARNRTGNRIVLSAILMSPAFFYWFYFLMYVGAYYTTPYIFR